MDMKVSYSGLPQGIGREHLMELVERLYRAFRLTRTSLAYLRAICRTTRHRDWSEAGGAGPRCYVRQTDLAREVGIDRRTANRIERTLERIGFIRIRRQDNHHRSGWSGANGETGIFLAPLVELYPMLAEMREAQLAEERALKAAHAQASVARGMLRKALRDAEIGDSALCPSERIEEAAAVLEASPARLAAIRNADVLGEIAEELTAALRLLQTAEEGVGEHDSEDHVDESATVEKPKENNTEYNEMSHAWDSRVTRLIHNTSKPKNVSCIRRTAIPADTLFNPDPADAGSDCLETKHETARTDVNSNEAACGSDGAPGEERAVRAVDEAEGARLPLKSLYRAASPEFRTYVDARAEGMAALPDFVFAAEMRRKELRIRDAAWDAAAELGYVDRAVAVLVLDQNQSHPTTPVLNPGGALLGMVKKARAEQLHLTPSVIGIIERTAQ